MVGKCVCVTGGESSISRPILAFISSLGDELSHVERFTRLFRIRVDSTRMPVVKASRKLPIPCCPGADNGASTFNDH